MGRNRTTTLGILGLLAGLAVGGAAHAGDSGPDLAQDAADLYCVRASEGVTADQLNDAIVAGQITIEVVWNADCAPGATLGSLTDAEHLGVYVMHVAGTEEGFLDLGEEFASLGSLFAAEDAETLVSELAADPDRMAAVLAPLDRALAFVEGELGWLEAHPPRACYAGSHTSMRGMFDQMATVIRDIATALRAGDAGMLDRAYADMETFGASGLPADAFEHTCL